MDELRKLLDITEQCMIRAVIAQREAAKYAEQYRSQAEEFRRHAARTRSPEVRAALLRIATSQARLTRLAEGVKSMSADASNGSDIRETPAEAAEASEYPEQPPRKKPAEDPHFSSAKACGRGAEPHRTSGRARREAVER